MPNLIWLQILFMIIFSLTGLLKLVRHPHMVEEFEKFDYPYALAWLAGACELIAVLLLALGFIFPPLTAVGGLLLTAVMTGAAYVNFAKRPAKFGWGVLPIVGLCLWLVVSNLDPLVQFLLSIFGMPA